MPGMCSYDLSTGDGHKTHMEKGAMPHTCMLRRAQERADAELRMKQCRRSSGRLSRSSNEGTSKWLWGGVDLT